MPTNAAITGFDENPKIRLKQLLNMTSRQQKAYLQKLNEFCPIKPWPCVMPCSAAPQIVVIGVSPGNSPRKEDGDPKTWPKTGEPPTFGKPHQGFNGGDTKNYWPKVRSLCRHFVRRYNRTMSDDECLALSSHLNLGTGQAGEASVADTDPAIIHWVATILNKLFQPNLIVCFGLNQILKVRFANWNHPDGLQIDWNNPNFEHPFDGYRFRLWEAVSAKGKRIGVLMWPNHPSRHPFAGGENGVEWNSALKEASLFLRAHNF